MQKFCVCLLIICFSLTFILSPCYSQYGSFTDQVQRSLGGGQRSPVATPTTPLSTGLPSYMPTPSPVTTPTAQPQINLADIQYCETMAQPKVVPGIDDLAITIDDRKILAAVDGQGYIHIPEFVDSSGKYYPALGSFYVGGKTISEIISMLQEKCPGQKINVFFATEHTGGIAMLGAFRTPTLLPVDSIGLYQAISAAGGLTEDASYKISVYRPGYGWWDGTNWSDTPKTFDCRAFFSGKTLSQNIFLKKGDIVTAGFSKAANFNTVLSKWSNLIYIILLSVLTWTQIEQLKERK